MLWPVSKILSPATSTLPARVWPVPVVAASIVMFVGTTIVTVKAEAWATTGVAPATRSTLEITETESGSTKVIAFAPAE